MKKILLMLCITISMQASSQFSVEGGIGMSSMGDVLQLKTRYENQKWIGGTIGMLAHMDNHNPAYFTGEFAPMVRVNDNFGITPHTGYGYKVASNNTTNSVYV